MEKILKDVENVISEVVELRRHFHKYPEVSKCEFETAKKIEKELINIGLMPVRVGETGVFAEIKGDLEGKTLALRADIDALPIQEDTNLEFKSVNNGVMHACGHDVHTASLIGAAKVLVQNRKKIKGTIKLIFQQAEEVGYGARVFIDSGYLQNVNGSFGIHIASDLKTGTIACVKGANNASVDWFKITVKGKSSHICNPDKGIDALYVISKIATLLKEYPKNDKLLIGIGKILSGASYNIIAEKGILEGTIRAFDNNLRKEVKDEIVKIANEIAKENNASVEVEYKDYTSALINDDEATQDAYNLACTLFGKDNVISNRTPSFSGDDFAELIIASSGTYAYVGTHNDLVEDTKLPHHNNKLVIDERSIYVATLMYTCYAINFLNK